MGLGLTESEGRSSIGAESSPGPVGTPVPMVGNDNLVAPLSREPLTFLKDPLVSRTTTRRRMTWAELMQRVFSVDVLECPVCKGRMKIVAEITEPKVIKRFLAALDLSAEVPVIARARPSPQIELDWADEVGQDTAVDPWADGGREDPVVDPWADDVGQDPPVDADMNTTYDGA